MVCQFLLYNKVNQLYIYICPHVSSLLHLPPSHPPHPTPLGGHKAPSWSPCAMRLLPTSDLFYVWSRIYVHAMARFYPGVAFEKIVMIELNLCFCPLSDTAQNYSVASKHMPTESKYHLGKHTRWVDSILRLLQGENEAPEGQLTCSPSHGYWAVEPGNSDSTAHSTVPCCLTDNLPLFNSLWESTKGEYSVMNLKERREQLRSLGEPG